MKGPVCYLGTHMPSWLTRLDIPMMVSRTRLVKRGTEELRATLPPALGPVVVDSGGFTRAQMYGAQAWDAIPARKYIADARRITEEVGNVDWIAPRDMMCERAVIDGGWFKGKFFVGTHLSVPVHQQMTVEDYVELRSIDDTLKIIPTLQGDTLDAYLRCFDLYERYGVDLTKEPTVGLGSVCRRENTAEIALIASTIARRGVRLHGFGVKQGLDLYAEDIVSYDTLAWSDRGRHVRPCAHGPGPRGRVPVSEANCIRFAMERRERLLALGEAAVSRDRQLSLDLFARPAA